MQESAGLLLGLTGGTGPDEAGEEGKGRLWGLQAQAKEFAYYLKSYWKPYRGLSRISLNE